MERLLRIGGSDGRMSRILCSALYVAFGIGCACLYWTTQPRDIRFVLGTAGAFTDLNYHLVFGTKDRRPLIREEHRDDLCRYLGGIIKGKKGHALEINAVADHAHLLVRLPPTVPIAEIVRALKASSSKWLNDTRSRNRIFGWQDGYAAFTVSQSQTARVAQYVRNQAEHHRTKSFREEFMSILERHQIAYDDRDLPG
jgi:putative transposase